MSKKSDMIYFDNFVACADCAVQAAKILERIVENFEPEHLSEWIDEIHEVEHTADVKKHDLMEELMRAFITPIEREDIMSISQYLDDEGDRLYMDSMRTLHSTSKDPVEIIVWRDVFKYLEDCVDACEHISDVVETVILKNT